MHFDSNGELQCHRMSATTNWLSTSLSSGIALSLKKTKQMFSWEGVSLNSVQHIRMECYQVNASAR